MVRKWIGDKAFYKMVIAVAIPIIVQNGITNFVSLLDNIMVGQVGTEQLSGVALANQLIMIFNLCIFGGVSGAGIFCAQFFGSGDMEGVRHTFRFKVIVGISAVVIAAAVFLLFGENLLSLYLTEGDASGDTAKTLEYGKGYLYIMLVGFLPFAFNQVYASTLRETGETFLPMRAGIIAVFVNLTFNYLLIFGHFGFPELGVYGAAYATVLSRFVELFTVVFVTHRHKEKYRFVPGLYKTLRIPKALCRSIIIKGMPLLANECLWSVGLAVLAQSYAQRGLAVVAAYNISNTVSHLFSIAFMAMGTAVSIIVGQLLGAGDMEKAKDVDRKLIFFSFLLSLGFAALLLIVSPLIPMIYNTTDEVKNLATEFLWIVSLCMPIQSIVHCCYFTLRSGGKTVITFIFDCVYVWAVNIPIAFTLVHFTNLPILPIYLIVCLSDLIKCVVGLVMIKKGLWMHNIVATQRTD